MRSRFDVLGRAAAAAAFVLFLASCRSTGGTAGLADRLEKLPALPPDVAATLDPKTQATRIPPTHPEPVRDPSVALAPCCGSKDQKALKVRVSLTKCAPLGDFIVAPMGDLLLMEFAPGSGPGGPSGTGVRVYRHGPVNRQSVWNTMVCMSSDGPWDATFTEERNCNGYQPQDSLIVDGWGGLVGFFWNGGPANHPAQVQVTSCNEIGLFRYFCGSLSSCDCSSSPCPTGQTCPCQPPW